MDKLLTLLKETCPGIDFETEHTLIDDGLLDSMDVIAIVSEIIHTFGVELSVEDLIPEHFNSATALMALIESRM